MRTRTIEVTVYEYQELSIEAKELVRARYRETVLECEWWTSTFADAMECGKRLGINIREDHGQAIYFNGFSSQGDGACFSGSYLRPETGVSATTSIAEYAPQDDELRKLAERLDALQARYRGSVWAKVEHTGRGCHEYSVTIECQAEADDGSGDAIDLTSEDEATLAQSLRDFMRWIYRQLEREYVARLSDESIEEDIEADARWFYKDGRRAPDEE